MKGQPIIVQALFRFAFRLILALAASLLVMRLVGAARPPSLLERATSNPDGTPCDQACMFGIQPGETSGEEAMRLLEMHPLTRNAEWTADHILRLAGLGYYVVFHVTPRGVVESIGMTATLEDMIEGHNQGIPAELRMELVTLGDYMLKFGVTGILFLDKVYLVFPNSDTGTLAVTVRPDDLIQSVDTDAPITALIISVKPRCGQGEFGAGDAWRGFRPLAHYAERRVWLRLSPSRFPMPDVRVCDG